METACLRKASSCIIIAGWIVAHRCDKEALSCLLLSYLRIIACELYTVHMISSK